MPDPVHPHPPDRAVRAATSDASAVGAATIAASRPASVFVAPVLIALATVYIVWGSTYFAIRLTLASYPPFLQGGIRFVIAGLLLFGFLKLRGRPTPTLRQWRSLQTNNKKIE